MHYEWQNFIQCMWSVKCNNPVRSSASIVLNISGTSELLPGQITHVNTAGKDIVLKKKPRGDQWDFDNTDTWFFFVLLACYCCSFWCVVAFGSKCCLIRDTELSCRVSPWHNTYCTARHCICYNQVSMCYEATGSGYILLVIIECAIPVPCYTRVHNPSILT